jgi:regulator of sigma E protease
MGSGEMDIKENVGGPIKMAQMFGYDWNWLRFWSLTALISMGLAFMNALPIPALDGGHAIVILFEMITGKKVSDKVLSILQTIGTVMVLALMIYVFYLDGSSLMKK